MNPLKAHEYKRYDFCDRMSDDEGEMCIEDAKVMSQVLENFRACIATCRMMAGLMHRNDDTLLVAIEQVEMTVSDEVHPIWSLMDDQIKQEG